MVIVNEGPVVHQSVGRPVRGWPRWSPERSFLWIGFFAGLLFLLITPPFQVADESRHFVRAYDISEKILYDLGWIPSHERLPASAVAAIETMEYMRFDPSAKTTLSHTLALMTNRLEPEKRAAYAETAAYSPISYLPQIALMLPFRLLGINAVITLYAARFCALLFWLAVTYWAIRKLPVAKHLLFFIALLPMTVFQAGSLSADCIALSLSFLLVAYYLHVAHRASYVDRRTMLLMSGLGGMLTAAKLVYAPLIGLHFLIAPSKFRSRRTYLLSFALTLLVCTVTLVLLYDNYVGLLFRPGQAVAPGGMAKATPYPQLNFLLADPLNGLRMAVVTGAKFGRTYMDGFVGLLGWSCASLPSYLYVVTIILMLLTALTTNGHRIIRPWHKLVFVGISLLITATICIAISTDSALNSKPTLLLLGIQGRYFTPFAPLLGLLAVNRSRLTIRFGRYVRAAVLPFVIFLLLNAFYCLVHHYYEV